MNIPFGRFSVFLIFFLSLILESRADESCSPPKVLTLESAINIALQSNRTLVSTFYALQKAGLGVKLALSAFDLKIAPKADLGYTGGGRDGTGATVGTGIDFVKQFTQGTRVSIMPYAVRTARRYNTNMAASIVQPLLRGFGTEYTMAGVRGSQYAYRTALRTYYIAQVSAVLRTIQAVFDVFRQEELTLLQEASVERLQRFTRATKLKEKIGFAEALDVYRAEIELKQAEDQLINTKNSFHDAEDALRELLALSQEISIQVDVSLDYQDVIMDADQAIQIALQNRIEIEQAKDQILESYRSSKIAKKNLWPELNIVLDYVSTGWDEAFTGAWSGNRENRWGVGFATSTFLDRTAENLAYQESLLTIDSSQRNLEEKRDEIVMEVKKSLRLLQKACEKIILQRQQILNAEGEFHLAQLKFNRGLANNFDVIQAEKNIHNSHMALLNSIIEHKVGQYKLLSAQGMLVDKPNFD